MLSRLMPCLLLFITFTFSAFAQTPANNLHYKSGQGHMIAVYKGTVFVNAQPAYKFPADNIVYKSKRNGLVEDKKSVFLFLEIAPGDGTKNKLQVFNINYSKADSVLTAIASDIKDLDKDGFLEFGGSEVAKPHPSPDSLYYNPSRFYEFKKGQIVFDAEYTETVDRKVNGFYLPDPLDKSGKCCVAVPKKKR